MSMSLDPLVGGLRSVLDLRLQQHALTASNLANANTPGFKAKVIDFSDALARAVDPHHGALATTRPGHLSASGGGRPEVHELEAPPWAVDGNSVVPERETARLESNSILYQAVVTGLDHKLALLKLAASDGKA